MHHLYKRMGEKNMKKRMCKALAMVLALIMCLNTVNLQAFAQEQKEQENVTDTTDSTIIESEDVLESTTLIEEVTTNSSSEEASTSETTTFEEEEITLVVETETSETDETFTDEAESTSAIEEETETEIETETETLIEENSTWDGITTQQVYEANDFRVTFSLSSYWDNGFNANIKVDNIGETTIENWYLDFDLQNEITNIWNAEISETAENGYIIKNAGWNQDITVGNSIEFGFSGKNAFQGFPQSYKLLGDSVAVSESDYTITYDLNNDWGNGFTGTISITNSTDSVLEDWALEFDFDREITNIWNATILSHEANHYTIMNAGYNSNIAAGQTISFGFNGQGGNAESEPDNYKLYSYQLEDNKTDIDVTADAEHDGLPDFMEDYFGTDKTKSDTDGDGLSDYIEIYSTKLDPLAVDSDNNGISDGDEDLDGDGLTNLREIELGTDLLKADSDSDNLNDYEEVSIYGTNPLKEDTDGDGASDGKEIEYGTNPLVADSSFTLSLNSTEEDTVKVSVSTTLSGNQVDSFQVEKYENELFFPDTMPGYLGGAYDFSVDGNIDSATIRFEFDSALLKDTSFDPVIYYFNEETQLLEELATTVNGNVASTVVSHFSKYILLNRTVYEDSFEWQDVWSSTGYSDVEVLLVIDDSGSMLSNDRTNQRLSVAQDLINKLPDNSKVGIVKFTASTYILTPTLVEDKEQAKSILTANYSRVYDGTNMYRAINSAFSLFESTNDTTLKMMVVLSDGETTDTNMHSSVIRTANANNIKIYTVGLGNSTSYFTKYLKPLAENTSAAFYLASNASELADIYNDINEKIDIETDSDGDGIADYYEENLTMFNGVTIKLDKNNPDSDGDGLYDGEEVVELNYEYNADKTQVKVTGKLISNPLNADTDGDGLTDEEEIYYYGTDPFKSDTDGDGLTDSLEMALWFDPLQADADGDGRLDLQEYQEGTSPFNYDKDWYEHVWDFLCGLIAGDFLQETDSVSVVLGQITSGLVPIADARDVIANAVHGDWGFAGLSAVGLIPVAGDITKTGSKIGKFILKNIDNAPKVANVLTFMTKNFPDITKELSKSDEFVDAIKQLPKTDTSKLTKKEVEGINEALEKAGLSNYKVAGNLYTLSKPSSKVLRENLIKAGIKVPDYPCAAHHIVAGSSQKAAEARAILQKYGIDINDAANGVFLPRVKDVTESTYHPSLHTDAYYRNVTELLSQAQSKNDVLDILSDIAQELTNGTFKY